MTTGSPSSDNPDDTAGRLLPVVERIAEQVTARRLTDEHNTVIGMAGGVAVGKSTTAVTLAELVEQHCSLPVHIVSGDGFLIPNAVLIERDLLHRKGFPESYDTAAIERLLTTARLGDAPLSIPVYDHLTYDVLSDPIVLDPPPVLLFESVNALHFAPQLDLSIYIDAAETSMRAWYLDRVLELRRRSVDEPSAFFAAFASLSEAEFAERAEAIWESVNLPNLREHIEPTRAVADIIIMKGSDHSIESVTVR